MVRGSGGSYWNIWSPSATFPAIPKPATATLLLPFASKQGGCAIDRMTVEEVTPEVVRKFLDHLQQDRQCSEVTHNQRLATIHSLARLIGTRSPVHLAWCSEIWAVPFKRDEDGDRIPRNGRDGRVAKPA